MADHPQTSQKLPVNATRPITVTTYIDILHNRHSQDILTFTNLFLCLARLDWLEAQLFLPVCSSARYQTWEHVILKTNEYILMQIVVNGPRPGSIFWVTMSARSLTKCSGCIPLLESVILPSFEKSGQWRRHGRHVNRFCYLLNCLRNANKSPEMSYSTMVTEVEKWTDKSYQSEELINF